MSLNSIGPLTEPTPDVQLAQPDTKKAAAKPTAPLAMPPDQVAKNGAASSPPDMRAAIESVGAAMWGAARAVAPTIGEGALALDPVTALGTLGVGAAVAAGGSPAVSREQAGAIGAREQQQFGGKTTDHVPSPYTNPAYVRTLPAQAELSTHPAPNPAAGHSPSTANGTTLHAQRYPYAATSSEGARAIVDVKSNCDPNDFKSFDSHAPLQAAMNAAPGEAMHHIVEQGGTNTPRFGTTAIQNTGNVVKLPQALHAKITGFYNTNARNVGIDAPGKVRDYIQSKSYAEQRAFGIEKTREFVKTDSSLSTEEKARINRQLDELDNPANGTGPCLPEGH